MPPSSRLRFASSAFTALLSLLLAGCAGMGGTATTTREGGVEASRSRSVPNHGPWPNPATRQLVVVVTPNWNAPQGRLARFQRMPGGGWQPVGGSFPVTVGRSGSGWGQGVHAMPIDGPQKMEGDGRAPAGVFAIGAAFGYADSAPTRLPYAAMQREHWCVDVPGSPLYNRIVDTREVGERAIEGSTEPMRRDLHKDNDQRYRLGFVIEHNAAGIDRAGSCIFAHLWEAPGVPTAGCTAMSETDMATLLGWLDPGQQPRFVLLPVQAYARLQAEWDLPAPGGVGGGGGGGSAGARAPHE
jgi:L,D-peptidoglycan transpeptidase YkuD (ErfK/YbiS/YcfS/YnhG family)